MTNDRPPSAANDKELLKRLERPKPSSMQWSKQYCVHYKPGFGDQPLIVHAATAKEAYAAGLAEFRRTTGYVESVDLFSLHQVVDHVEEA